MQQTLFITGTDTGVGKTVVSALITEFLFESGVRVAALKPVCSGGRGDARRLHAAMGGALALDRVNPWHFRAPIAPVLAARREKRAVWRADALAHIRGVRRDFEVTLVEGAGGLLSPLGEDFNSRDLIAALRATPIIVARNQLGMVNHLLLTIEALPKAQRQFARVVLVMPPKADSATSSNASLLEQLSVRNVHHLPWFTGEFSPSRLLSRPGVRRMLAHLLA